MRIGKPVKWVESRRENFLCTIHGRGHVDYFELAAKRDGTMRGSTEADPGFGRVSSTAHARHSDASVLMMPGCTASRTSQPISWECLPTVCHRRVSRRGRPEATHGIDAWWIFWRPS